MTVVPHAPMIRQLVSRVFHELGVRAGHLGNLRERIRIDRGRYVSRTYRAGDLMAMWLVDYGLLQFYDHDGQMLKTVNLLEELHEEEAAA